jgi:hypothetical protein
LIPSVTVAELAFPIFNLLFFSVFKFCFIIYFFVTVSNSFRFVRTV